MRDSLAKLFCGSGFGVLVPTALLVGIGCAGLEGASSRAAPTPSPSHVVTGSGGATTGPLRLARAELNFSNDRSETTVRLGAAVEAYAVLRFNGNGLFRGTWLVDGVPVENVSFPVSFGNTVTVRTGPGTVLPTFEPGIHRLTLRAEEPAGPPTPEIRYFVTGERDSPR